MDAVSLDHAEVLHIGNVISPRAGRSKRLFTYLAAHPNSPSRKVIQNVGISNLSEVAHQTNEAIFPSGVMIGCIKPLTLGSEPGSQEHLWSVFRVHPVAKNNNNLEVQDATNGTE